MGDGVCWARGAKLCSFNVLRLIPSHSVAKSRPGWALNSDTVLLQEFWLCNGCVEPGLLGGCTQLQDAGQHQEGSWEHVEMQTL
jgi:hypothetical protein